MQTVSLATWGYALGAVLAVSLASLFGAFLLTLRPKSLHENLHVLVAFAAGALFGDAFIHLLPEAFERAEDSLTVSLLVLLGLFLFLVLERLILWRTSGTGARPVVFLNLVGDGAHNFADGLIIGASFCVSPALGFTTALAVLLHEIPQELGDFGVLVHGGLSHGKALGFNALSALCAVVGAVISLALGPMVAGFPEAMLPVTAGGFIYIAGSTLIPDILSHVEPKSFPKELVAMLAGVGVMVALAFFE
jgi:zinc and cadmium transporter